MHPLILSALLSAPAPQPLPQQVTPGHYRLTLAQSTWTYHLRPDGSCASTGTGYPCFSGSWSWCPHTRTLRLNEGTESSDTLTLYTLTLRPDLTGECVAPHRTPCSLIRVR